MSVAFEAKYIDCSDAIDGEILQVIFDTVPATQDEEQRRTPYVLISRNFEFPGPGTVEWYDGEDFDACVGVISVTLKRGHISIKLERGLELAVKFHLSDKQFAELTSFLRRMIQDHLHFAD